MIVPTKGREDEKSSFPTIIFKLLYYKLESI